MAFRCLTARWWWPAVMCLLGLNGYGQPTFERSLFDEASETPVWTGVAADDGYFILSNYQSGFAPQSALVVKTDTAGETQWQFHFSGDERLMVTCGLATPDGGLLVAGAYGGDMAVFRVDGGGRLLWTQRYERGVCMSLAFSGDQLLALHRPTTSGWFSVVSLSADDGGVAWRMQYAGPDYFQINRHVATPDGGAIACGSVVRRNNDEVDALMVRLSAQGDVIWARSYGGAAYDYAVDVCGTPDGGFCFVGGTYSFHQPGQDWNDPYNEDAYFVKTNAAGRVQWSYQMGGIFELPHDTLMYYLDRMSALTIDSEGRLLAVGTRDYFEGMTDVYVYKLHPDDASVYAAKRLGGLAQESGVCVAATPDGGAVMLGRRYGHYDDILLIKADSELTNRSCMPDLVSEGLYTDYPPTEEEPVAVSAMMTPFRTRPAVLNGWEAKLSNQKNDIYVDATVRPITCPDSSNGAIEVHAQGGMGDFVYYVASVDSCKPLDCFPREARKLWDGLGPGAYLVLAADANMCYDTMVAVIDSIPRLRVDVHFPDYVCVTERTPFIVSAHGGQPPLTLTASFQDGELPQHGEMFLQPPGPYVFYLKDGNGCTFERELKVALIRSSDAGPDERFVLPTQQGARTQFRLTGGLPEGGYWTGPGVTDAKLGEIDLKAFAKPGRYVIRYFHSGCSDDKILHIEAPPAAMSSIWPDAFSPNGDGVNDVFNLPVRYAQAFELVVFDRWGKEVYRSDNLWNHGWDGAGAAEGVYPYIVRLTDPDGKQTLYKGSITLIR